METIIFGDKKITIRGLSASDLKNADKFKDFINSFVEEDAKLSINKKISKKEEETFIAGQLKLIKAKTRVYLVAEHDKKIAGTSGVELEKLRKSHIGRFGIAIAKNYRGIGLGEYMTKEAIRIAKKELKPKFIQLEVYANNIPAISLYKKSGFKKVARIPRQLQHGGKLIDELIMIREI